MHFWVCSHNFLLLHLSRAVEHNVVWDEHENWMGWRRLALDGFISELLKGLFWCAINKSSIWMETLLLFCDHFNYFWTGERLRCTWLWTTLPESFCNWLHWFNDVKVSIYSEHWSLLYLLTPSIDFRSFSQTHNPSKETFHWSNFKLLPHTQSFANRLNGICQYYKLKGFASA